MNIQLPPRIGNTPASIGGDVRRITIIGANGSGKTRFTDEMIRREGPLAWRISALDALYGRDMPHDRIDEMYALAKERSPLLRNDIPTRFDCVMGLLMMDEMVSLVSYKAKVSEGEKARMPRTRFDRLMKIWREIFPGNTILLDGGRLSFDSDTTGERPANRLSQGEKAVLYYIAMTLLADRNAMLFIENPTIFLHPSVTQTLWNRLEDLRRDCTFIYTTHDVEFASSRSENMVIWVRSYNPVNLEWDYKIIPPSSGLPDDIYLTIIGARRPVLFIEGDGTRSIDSKLYPLVFKGYTVKSLGSCNKVIESVRTFNDLQDFHHLESRGIVDRDRRDEHEVEYLRRKNIMVPDVAEIENLMMLEDVIRAMARYLRRDERGVYNRVRRSIFSLFSGEYKQQALEHTRHRIKRLVEYGIDRNYKNINLVEEHIRSLVDEVRPRAIYEEFCRDFKHLLDEEDYRGILRVFNYKTMITQSGLPNLLGLHNRNNYLDTMLKLLRSDHPEATVVRDAIIAAFS